METKLKFVPAEPDRKGSKYDDVIATLLKKGEAQWKVPKGADPKRERHILFISVRGILQRRENNTERLLVFRGKDNVLGLFLGEKHVPEELKRYVKRLPGPRKPKAAPAAEAAPAKPAKKAGKRKAKK